MSEEKLKRLVTVSKLYYEENKTQAEIARIFRVSRPMVSKLLAEARAMGVVTIHITDATSYDQIAGERLAERFGLANVLVVPMERDPERTDNAVVTAAYELVLKKLKPGGCLGLGWGSLMGRLADYLEEKGEAGRLSGSVCPLIGNAAATYRSYHPNELVRIFSQRTGLAPSYIYGPAMAETEEEKRMYQNTDAYASIKALWERLDLALVNISNYPSSPDMATALRFGSRLAKEKAAGHILSYFYNREGNFILEEDDRLLRIPLKDLKKAGSVAALCAGGVNTSSLEGALASGLITDLVLNEAAAAILLEHVTEGKE